MKKVVFVNEPNANANGQYNFDEAEFGPFQFTQSSGLPPRYDKFSDKDLYTVHSGNNTNEAIIDGNLRYVLLVVLLK